MATALMRESKESAADIAEAIYKGVERGEFLILPSAIVRRSWRIKRWFPEIYFRKLMQLVRARGGK